MIKEHKLGVVLGSFFAVLHAAWSVIVMMGWGQTLVDWKIGMHGMKVDAMVSSMTIGSAITLVVVAFIGGYLFGRLFGFLWNRIKV